MKELKFICIQAPLYKMCFLILGISISCSEAYLEPTQISTTEIVCASDIRFTDLYGEHVVCIVFFVMKS